MPANLPYVGYFATTEALLHPERFDYRSLRIVAAKTDEGVIIQVPNEAMADHFSVTVCQRSKHTVTEHFLGDFVNKADAEIFRQRIARILDNANEIAETAMCLWEVILYVRASKKADETDAFHLAVEATYEQHGTCAMRSAINDLSEACDREYGVAATAEEFDGSFDWEWCPNWLRTRVTWDETGEELPKVAAVQ